MADWSKAPELETINLRLCPLTELGLIWAPFILKYIYMYDIVVSSFVKRSPGPWFGKPYLMVSSSMTVKVSGFYLAAKSDYW